MAVIDVFNGDADGVCALTQWRNAHPCDSELVTGVKRDIELMDRLSPSAGDEITVLDVSLDKNRAGLEKALAAGARVFYVDHHYAGEIPEHENLRTVINPGADVCTALLINGELKGRFAQWAIVGAFGDNLKQSAQALARQQQLDEEQVTLLDNLGVYINYNGYGASVDDLHFHPAELFRRLRPYASPFAFVEDARETFEKLEHGFRGDMAAAAAIPPERASDHAAVFILPDEAWARRVSGVYSNDLANDHPDRAHAVLTLKPNGNYLISVRAPLANKSGADELCRQFPTGGGRAAAAGVNDLPGDQLQTFVDRFDEFYRGR